MEHHGSDSQSSPGDQMTKGKPNPLHSKHRAEKEDSLEKSGKKAKVEFEQASGTDGGSSKSKGKKSKQAIPACSDASSSAGFGTSRWSHKASNYSLTPSLLEEVLNEKKMAIMRSPAVIEQLQLLQKNVRESGPSDSQQQHQPEQQQNLEPQEQQPPKLPEHGQLQQLQAVQQQLQDNNGQQLDISSVKEEQTAACPAAQLADQGAEIADTKTRLDIQEMANKTEIWSRESSAFSSVPSSSKYS